jgi:hypothetical protein
LLMMADAQSRHAPSLRQIQLQLPAFLG